MNRLKQNIQTGKDPVLSGATTDVPHSSVRGAAMLFVVVVVVVAVDGEVDAVPAVVVEA